MYVLNRYLTVHKKTHKIWVFVSVFFFFCVFGLSNSCKCLQYYNLILVGGIAQEEADSCALHIWRVFLFSFFWLSSSSSSSWRMFWKVLMNAQRPEALYVRILKERASMRGEKEEAAAALVVVLHQS